jgi:hypothetical protein
MTLALEIDDVAPREYYVATSGQTEFIVPFVFFDDADLLVYVNDELVDSDDYTVAGELDSDPASRKVTFDTGLTVNDAVAIIRDIPIERTSNFPASGPFSIPSLNLQLAKIFAIMQQLESAISRTLRLPDSDAEENLDIPSASERANKFLAFDADGAPIVAETVTDVPVSAFMQTVLDDTNAAAARNTLGITDTSAYAGISNWHFCR